MAGTPQSAGTGAGSGSSAGTDSSATQSTPNTQGAPTTTEPPDRPITHLFQNLVEDIRALPTVDTALILAVGGSGAAVLHLEDDNLRDWAAARGASGYTKIGGVVGDGWVQGGLAIATYAGGLVAHDRRVTHVGSDLIRAQFLNAILTQGSKAIAQRRRPSGGPHAFPSGHTSASFASAVVVQEHFGWKPGVAAYAMAGFVGWTRVRDRAHWLSDVVAGATVGTLVGHAVTKGHHLKRWAVVPSAGAGGVAVQFIRLERSPVPRR